MSCEEARREYMDAEREWLAALRRLRDVERQKGPMEPTPADAPPAARSGWERWERLLEQEAAARVRKEEKERAYNDLASRHS